MKGNTSKSKQAVLPVIEFVLDYCKNPEQYGEESEETIVNHGKVKSIIDDVLNSNIVKRSTINWLNKLKQHSDTSKLHPVPPDFEKYESHSDLINAYPDRWIEFMYNSGEWNEDSSPYNLEENILAEVGDMSSDFEISIYRGVVAIINKVNMVRRCTDCKTVFAISGKGQGAMRKYCSRKCSEKSYRKRKKRKPVNGDNK